MNKCHSLFLLLLPNLIFASDSLKTANAVRVDLAPKIDGLLDDEAWKNAEVISGFTQHTPEEGGQASQKTEVKVVYDDYAFYIGAMMYDSSPDSILKELGNRDDEGLNAEKFRFVVDPYNNYQDAYSFEVYSSGVQVDYRQSDETYNGVWQSAIKILENGWSLEMLIPYSAIRFPNSPEQTWSVQFTRDIRRNREFDQWCLTPSGQANPQKFWGILQGISSVKPPLRLSLTPYFSSYLISAPEYFSSEQFAYSNSLAYNAGADIKYGLDERFTLDMTLLPDFGQVQSDNKVKNLSYREVTYDDYRPFFKEGTELFSKNSLFYSRRIGREPTLYSDVGNLLQEGEIIIKNPSQAKLINATKVTGRTNEGLGVGLFNAVTNNTFAVLKDSSGNERKILTEPFTNYNAVVFDQQFKNSSIYLINTNVARPFSGFHNANVSGTGFYLQNKKNTWGMEGSAAVSNLFSNNYENGLISGYHYSGTIEKISGSWQYGLTYESMSNAYDRSDMGYQSINDYSGLNLKINHNLYKPLGFIFRAYNNANIFYSYNFTTGLPTNISTNLNLFLLFKDYSGIFVGGGAGPASGFDYNEPRTENRYFRTSEWYYFYSGFTTDYRKRFALDMTLNTGNFLKGNIQGLPLMQGYGGEIKPRFRASDRLSFIYAFTYGVDPLNVGYVSVSDDGTVIFGGRELITYVNVLSSKYIFKNDLSLTLNARHYWNTGRYLVYYDLLENGMLSENKTYSTNYDFSYNAFNIDLVFSWQFSPGSVFSVAYKNAIEEEGRMITNSYANNFAETVLSPQSNSISLKILYYLDYEYLRRRR